MQQPSRDSAWALLNEYTKSESLLKHALAVEAAMRWYAEYFKQSPEEIEKWGITGLIHDFDYEQYPTATDHPFKGNQILKEVGYPDDIREAIMGHATYSGVPRASLMAKALFAVDELSGLVTASVLVRPDKSIHNLEVKSVRKKMKDKAFARGVNRDDVILGAQELGIELEQHIANVVEGLRRASKELGLSGAV